MAAVSKDLIIKGYVPFMPIFADHLPYDMLAVKDDKYHKLQVKYISGERQLPAKKSGSASLVKKYVEGDFDFFAVYLPEIDKVIYPHFNFKGHTIRTTIPNSPTLFYWWEDFQEFTTEVSKKHYKNFGLEITKNIDGIISERNTISQFKNRKVDRPSKEELEKLIWEKPTSIVANEIGVSDKAITNWCKSYGIDKPPRGYWTKVKSESNL